MQSSPVEKPNPDKPEPEKPDLEKAELEKRKLAAEIRKAEKDTEKTLLEINTHEERLQLERQRVRNEKARFVWETVRLLGVALVTGLISYFTTRTMKDREFKEIKSNLQITRFDKRIEDLSKLPTTQEKNQTACSIYQEFHQSPPPEIVAKLQNLNTMCQNAKSMALNIKQGEQAAHQAQNANTAPRVKATFDNLEREINNIEQLVVSKRASAEQLQLYENLQDSFNKVLKEEGIQKISAKSDDASEQFVKNLEETKKLTQTLSNDLSSPRMVEGFPKTGWFKEGFFLVFNGIKIYLENLDASAGIVIIDVCKVVSNAPCAGPDILKEGAALRQNAPVHFEHDGYNYTIRLDRIGSAGKNPFSKAAYISLEKYSK